MAEIATDIPTRRQLTATALIGALMLLVAGAWVLAADRMPLDRPAHGWSRDLSGATGNSIARLITHFGDAPIMYVVAALMTLVLLAWRKFPEAAVMGFGMLLTIGLIRVGKAFIDRQRPFDQIAHAHGHSFPSGHSAYGFTWVVIGVIAVRLLPSLQGRRWPIWLGVAVALLVPLTRVYLRAHWASDTIAGLGEAMMSFSLVALAVMAVSDRRRRPAAED